MNRNPAELIIIEKDLVTRRIADETIIVPVRSGVGDLSSIYTLNESGSFTWGLIEKGMPFVEIVRALTDEYEVSLEEAERDTTALLQSLNSAGLIRFVREGAD